MSGWQWFYWHYIYPAIAIGCWELVQWTMRLHKDSKANPYRWECPSCRMEVKSNKPHIVELIAKEHVHTYH